MPAPSAGGQFPNIRTRTRLRVSTAARLALVAGLAALAAVVAYGATVLTPSGQLVGELMLGGRSAGGAVDARQVLSLVTGWTLLASTALVVALGLVQRRPRLATVALLTVAGANLSSQLLKNVLLGRTDLLDGQFYPLPNSFPSGHVTAVASIAVALILVIPPLVRAPAVIISAAIVAFVGANTMVAGWHRMADVAGGTCAAVAWGAALAAVLAWRRDVERVGPRVARLGGMGARIPVGVGALVASLGGVAYLVAVLDPLDVMGVVVARGSSPALFAIGVAIAAGASLVFLGLLAVALNDVRLDPPFGASRGPRVQTGGAVSS